MVERGGEVAGSDFGGSFPGRAFLTDVYCKASTAGWTNNAERNCRKAMTNGRVIISQL